MLKYITKNIRSTVFIGIGLVVLCFLLVTSLDKVGSNDCAWTESESADALYDVYKVVPVGKLAGTMQYAGYEIQKNESTPDPVVTKSINYVVNKVEPSEAAKVSSINYEINKDQPTAVEDISPDDGVVSPLKFVVNQDQPTAVAKVSSINYEINKDQPTAVEEISPNDGEVSPLSFIVNQDQPTAVAKVSTISYIIDDDQPTAVEKEGL